MVVDSHIRSFLSKQFGTTSTSPPAHRTLSMQLIIIIEDTSPPLNLLRKQELTGGQGESERESTLLDLSALQSTLVFLRCYTINYIIIITICKQFSSAND
uniref:Uncharacterized protein n=1 Tax=Arundo donax TaxID=35708 RepID=A0A0A9DD47_ARUDO